MSDGVNKLFILKKIKINRKCQQLLPSQHGQIDSRTVTGDVFSEQLLQYVQALATGRRPLRRVYGG